MEVVRQFSNEINTVLDGKLPVSRAKMASITKLALKASKYYKHVVMAVEKFVSKCAPEYKVPGLYVIDSIVRQSRHQFGADKDNFGPRFSKSFEKTFLNLFLCSSDHKPKIIRVLNLWQKNGVFPSEVIQPLLALAPSPEMSPSKSSAEVAPPPSQSNHPLTDNEGGGTLDLESANVVIQQQQSQIQALLQQQQQLQSQASTLLGPALHGLLSQASDSVSIANLVKQTQQLQQLATQQQHQQLTTANGDSPPPAQMSNKAPHSNTEFNTALLDDFDYSDDEDDVDRSLSQQRERLQAQESEDNNQEDATDHMLQELQAQFQLQESMKGAPPVSQSNHSNMMLPPVPSHLPPRQDLPMVPPLFPPPSLPVPPPMNFPPHPPLPSMDYKHSSHPPPPHPSHYHPPRHSPSPPHHRSHNRERFSSPPNVHQKRMRRMSPSPPRRNSGAWREQDWDRDRDRRHWSPWRRSRSPPRRDRKDSCSITPPYRSPRRRSQRSPEERDRSAKHGAHKEKHVTVLSTTIWLGHLAKSVSKDQITQACEEVGQVQSVDVVSARGCAYVVMETRGDAINVLSALKDLKFNGSTCKLAWAPGRGVKGASYRNFWNLDNGFSIIPWNLINSQTDLDGLMDGGCIEPPTCPPGMVVPEPHKVPEPLPPQVPPHTLPPPVPMYPPLVPLSGPQPVMFPSAPPGPLLAPNYTNPPPKERSSEDGNAGTNVDMQLDSPLLDSEL